MPEELGSGQFGLRHPALAWLNKALGRLPAASPGSTPLRRYLLIWLLVPQLVLWLGAAVVSYQVAARYANLAIDRSLYQSSRALARQVKPTSGGLLIDFPRAARDIIETDPDEQVYYTVSSPPGKFILGNKALAVPPSSVLPKRGALPSANDPRFYDDVVQSDQHKKVAVRVVALYLAWGEGGNNQTMLVQIAKSRVSRDALASRIMADTALPLIVLVLLMSVIVWASIRAGLAPLARLRHAVVHRSPGNLEPIELGPAPEEVRVLTTALNSMLKAVQEGVMGQRRFISDAAHQLRTPLAGLKSQTELALKETDDPALKARLSRVHESATRSAHLVNQLLTLARAEPESTNAMGRSRFDIGRLVCEVTAELVPRALQARVDLGMAEEWQSSHNQAVLMFGNALLIREAVFNVIDNAIRYAGRDSEVTVRVGVDVGAVFVEVDDTGQGISPDHLEAVFERFYRATHEGTGCGLGLAIVKEIVERHAGTVTLSNRKPHGLCVRLSFPRSASLAQVRPLAD
jgi:two-component system sensor histidine kinase TctE